MVKFINGVWCAAGVLALACGCSGGPGHDVWTLNGSVPETGGTVYVDAPAAGGAWRPVDSVSADAGSRFRMELPAMPHETVYRLRTSAHVLYFPVDSTEFLTYDPVSGTVGGSGKAALFSSVDSLIRADFTPGMAAEADSLLKRRLLGMLSGHYDSQAAYYVVRKNVGGRPLLSPLTGSMDYKLFRAVVNSFSGFRPEDPRTRQLVEEFGRIEATRRSASGVEPRTGVIYAPEISYFEIALGDCKGRERRLSESVDSNRVVVLSFVNFANEGTGLFNMALGDLYEKRHRQGLEIYQVGFDTNQHSWSAVAGNLPWVSVYQSEGASQVHLNQYAVAELPTVFIIADGEIKERVDSPDGVVAAVEKYFK